MKRMIHRVLFDTRPGDLLLRLIERVAGVALVDVGELDYQVAATEQGRAQRRAPTRV